MSGFIDGVVETGVTAILELVLMGLLVGLAALYARSWVRRGKVWVKGDEGHTRMSPFVPLVGLLCAAMAVGCLTVGLLNPEPLEDPGQFIAWTGLVASFGIVALIILPFAWHTWNWNRDGIRWQSAWRSVSLPWSSIASAGKTWDGQVFVVDAEGNRILWSTYTLEQEALRDALAARRPDIALPPF